MNYCTGNKNDYLIALMIRLVLLSALLFWRSITAQTAAGNQPISVSWSKRQIINFSILPLSKKDSHGSNIAMSVILFV